MVKFTLKILEWMYAVRFNFIVVFLMSNKSKILKDIPADFVDLSVAVGQYFQQDARQSSSKNAVGLRYSLGMAIEEDARLLSCILQSYRQRSKSQRIQVLNQVKILLKNLKSYCNGLERDGVKELEYLDLLRRRVHSIRWVS